MKRYTDEELHPYYVRKAKRDAEFMDKALIPFFKWAFIAMLVIGLVDYAIS